MPQTSRTLSPSSLKNENRNGTLQFIPSNPATIPYPFKTPKKYFDKWTAPHDRNLQLALYCIVLI